MLPECVHLCLVGGGQTLTPKKRPRFPFLTSLEHASPWLRAALLHPGAGIHCSLGVWLNITYVPLVSLHRLHGSAVCSTFSFFLLGCSHALSVHPFIPPSSLSSPLSTSLFPDRGRIRIHQRVTARVCHVLIEWRTGERRRRGEIKRGKMRERNAQTGMHIA